MSQVGNTDGSMDKYKVTIQDGVDTVKRKLPEDPTSPDSEDYPSQIPHLYASPDLAQGVSREVPHTPTHPLAATTTPSTIAMHELKVNFESQGQALYLSEYIFNTMNTPAFITAITPLLIPALTVALHTVIQASVQSAVQQAIVPLTEQIQKQNQEIVRQSNHIACLQNQNSNLSARVDQLEIQVEEQEQYSRRTCLRFHNISPEIEDTDQKVLDICRENLGLDIKREDIGRSHFVGKVNKRGRKQVIVRFLSYRKRAEVYANKKNLKGHPDKIFITEDLTVYRRHLVNKLIEMQHKKMIISFWTNDGRVFAKKVAGGPKLLISNFDDINSLAEQ